MGYRHDPRTISVVFDGEHKYAGFEAKLRSASLKTFFALHSLGDVDQGNIVDQSRAMGESLISWNLEDENGTPVPATPEAVLEQDEDLMFELTVAWLAGLRGAPTGPLETSSTGGEPSLEASLPMEPPSESLAS